MNKKKIINDPLYGFISIPHNLIFDIIEHPYFQRLRHIKQLGLTAYVFPGALHTRFHHALGAMHLMTKALDILKAKKVALNKKTRKAAILAILLHDIGHGPFSHALEYSIVKDIKHETLSLLFMKELNKEFNGELSLAIEIFQGNHPKHFLHQLLTSQLDVDRIDYLNRDSFFTGVQEGIVGSQRIIEMLQVRDNKLVVEAKGIYSVEKFLIARRLMYWQVYLHKTVLGIEKLLVSILKRAKMLIQQKANLFASPSLQLFLENDFTQTDFEENAFLLNKFAELGDEDIFSAIKVWQQHRDPILSFLSISLVQRKLFKVILQKETIDNQLYKHYLKQAQKKYKISKEEAKYLVFTGTTSNSAYTYAGSQVNILQKNNAIQNITKAADNPYIDSLARPVVKHYLCYPKELSTKL